MKYGEWWRKTKKKRGSLICKICGKREVIVNADKIKDYEPISYTKWQVKTYGGIVIDPCIANEINDLINKYNIITLNSCCGHNGNCEAHIKVHKSCKDKMLRLGYKLIREHNDAYMFEPKTNHRE